MNTGADKGRSRLSVSSGCTGNISEPENPPRQQPRQQPEEQPPARLVSMARLGAPHGVRGFMRLHIFSRQPEFFLQSPFWWCRRQSQAQQDSDWQRMAVAQCVEHGRHWLVRLADVQTREDAAGWCNAIAAVAYEALPAAAEEHFYWCDLIGLRVENGQGDTLGEVTDMMDIGAHDVLCVRAPDGAELLIPFVSRHIIAVQLAEDERVIRVDWQRDWS